MVTRPGTMVEVEWIDSHGSGEWNDPEQADKLLEDFSCVCCGYLIRDKPQGIVIALGSGGSGGVLSLMAIPREAIKQIHSLRR